jgi:predicted O-linked N-acetylglucosamine transferase (SPINDLY family)
MATVAELLTLAWRAQEAGDLLRAEQLYRQAATADNQNDEPWSRLGVVCLRLGKLDEAIVCLQRALQLKPGRVDVHSNLGVAYASRSRFEEATACFEAALRLQPDYLDAEYNLGKALQDQGRFVEAEWHLRQVVQRQPSHAPAHASYGFVLTGLNRLDEAIATLKRAVELAPADAQVHNALGFALMERGQLDGAVTSLEQACRLQPGLAQAHANLGMALARQGKTSVARTSAVKAAQLGPDSPEVQNAVGVVFARLRDSESAITYFDRALHLRPKFAAAYSNRGDALRRCGRLEDAAASLRQALALEPNYAPAHHNLAITYADQRKLPEALREYTAALHQQPNNPDWHKNRAITLLLLGEWAEGWKEFEWRWQCEEFARAALAAPRWEGGSLVGKTILLVAEQGLGDTLQFIRYAALVKQTGGTVLVECPKALHALVADCAGVDGVVPEGGPRPSFDVQAPLLSLPALFGTTTTTVPGKIPYLTAAPEAVAFWRERLRDLDGLRVGVYWQGNPSYPGDRHRSFRLLDLAPLAGVSGVRLVSLQVGPGVEQLDTNSAQLSIIDLRSRYGARPTSFMDTAAIMKNLDLVVTCDSAVGHLAGALSVPVWLALSAVSDFRWLLDRADTPWYPTMRLYRQKQLGDWNLVFTAMAHDLAAQVATEPAEALAHAWQIQREGQLAPAEILCRQILHAHPEDTQALSLLGTVCLKQGKLDESIAAYQRLLQIKPQHLLALNNLGVALGWQGKLAEAAAYQRLALQLQPHDAAAHNNLGATLRQLGHLTEAEQRLREAIRLKSDYVDAYSNLGQVLYEQLRLPEAAASIREALRLRPGLVEAHCGLAAILHAQGHLAEAQFHYDEAQRHRPNPRMRLVQLTMLPAIYSSLEELHDCRRTLIQNLEQLRREGTRINLDGDLPAPLFYLAYQSGDDREIMEDFAQLHIAPSRPDRLGENGDATPQIQESRSLSHPDASKRIKIGFVSRFFRQHTIGELLGSMIPHLDRHQFRITVFSVGHYEDAMAQAIRTHADGYVELPANVPTARRLIAEQELDLLFYPDIGMEWTTYALAFSRLAPVQCVTWGHPVTTGIPTIDYYLSSEWFETDAADGHYSEKLIRLKSLPFYCPRPVLPPAARNRADFNLPAEPHLYGCPQSLFKIHPDFDALLGEILRCDPQGLLLLHQTPGRIWHEQLRQRFTRTIPDVVDRIHFLPRLSAEDFLHLNVLVDVLLDPIHFNGGHTTLLGLAVGTPIVTLPSPFLRGRITQAMYRRIGVTDCIARTAEEYVAVATRLGTDPSYRAAMQVRILASNAVLYDNEEPVRELEAWFKHMAPRTSGRVVE